MDIPTLTVKTNYTFSQECNGCTQKDTNIPTNRMYAIRTVQLDIVELGEIKQTVETTSLFCIACYLSISSFIQSRIDNKARYKS